MQPRNKHPKCPKCGSTMIGYSDPDNDNSDVRWLCTRAPNCTGFVDTKNSDKKEQPKKSRQKTKTV